MTNLTIKTHQKDQKYSKPHFFILNKGLNSGKPLKTPCPNCFVIQFNSSNEVEKIFWIASSLWKSNFWHQFLVGSVIPFLRIDDFRKDFILKCNTVLNMPEKFNKNFEALTLLEEQQTIFENKLKLIKELKSAYFSLYR
jgi:hypothetical protein